MPEDNGQFNPSQWIADFDKEVKYGTTGEMLKTAAEGAAEGALGPLATTGELALGANPEDIRARRETNPITHGLGQVAGFTGSMLSGEGIAPLVAKAGNAVTKTAGVGGMAAGALQFGTETALLQAGDEITKKLIEDPESSLGNAVANIGLSGLLGSGMGAAGSGLSSLWKSQVGGRAENFINDFRSRMQHNISNPDLHGVLSEELGNHYNGMKSMADEVYGASGLKARDIAKSVPELNEKIMQQNVHFVDKVDSLVQKMTDKPYDFSPRLTEKLTADLENYKSVLSNAKDSGEMFNATQDLKQTLQGYAKYERMAKPTDEDYGFIKASKSLANDLKTGLEDASVWGKAAERQTAINKAFSDYLPSLKDFERKFTVEIGGERSIDPQKVHSYLNNLGKPTAEVKKEMLENFVKASDKYKNTIAETHANLGLDAPQFDSSLVAARHSLEDITPGMAAADLVYKKGAAKLAGGAIGAGIGGGLGRLVGHAGVGAIIGEHALGPFFESILPALTKGLRSGTVSADGLKGAVDYGMKVVKGEALISKAAKNVFKAGAEILPESAIPTEKRLARLNASISTLEQDPTTLLNHSNNVSTYLPGHGEAIGELAARASQIINSLKPNTGKSAPLDPVKILSSTEKAKYREMLIIAEQPLSVMKHIKDGTITPQQVQMMSTLYPGLYNNLKNKLTSELIDHTSKGGEVNYRTKLGLSAFLGQPLESSIMPYNMLVNMNVGKPSSGVQQRNGGPSSGSKQALNKLPGMYSTPNQARSLSRLSRK